MLTWITCVDNYCNIYYAPKLKNNKWPRRTKWDNSKKKFKDTIFMHEWHPNQKQNKRQLIIELEKFLSEECLNGCQ